MRIVSAFLIILLACSFFLWPQVFDLSKFGRFSDKSTDISAAQNGLRPVENFKAPPSISAKSAIIINAVTGTQIYEKDADTRHLPASTTKLMTGLVVAENCDINDSAAVVSLEKEGTQMGLKIGDVVTIETLLYGMLISSGNDAATLLATSCDRDYAQFISLMNEKAKELGMTNTHFVNPIGFDNSLQYSTARDLAKLAKVAIADPLISKIVAVKSTVKTDVTGSKTYYLENVNKLLGVVNGLDGVKTGQTEGSGEILISKVERGNVSVICVVLGSADRFEESKQLIEWAYQNYHLN